MQPELIASGDRVGERIRALDWSATPLGPITEWPQSLVTALGMILHSKFPTYLAWGPELTSFYNDAYHPILGKKPEALGRPFREVWSEAWDVIGPLAERALGGEASYHEDLPLTLERQGYPEQTWWTFSYSPIPDEVGRIAGILCTVHETTAKVLSEQRLAFLVRLTDRLRSLSDPAAVAPCAAAMLGQHLQASRAGYGEIDEAEEVVSVKRDWSNGKISSLAGEVRILEAFGPTLIMELKAGHTLVVEDCLTDPRAGQAYAATWASIATRSLIVVPLVKGGRLRALFYVHEPQPRRWSEAEATLVRDVAERIWDAVERSRAEMALRGSEGLKGAILEAALDCIITVTSDSRVVDWNSAAERTFGYPASAALGQDLAQLIIPPEFRERHHRGMTHYLATGEGPVLGQRIELTALRADGSCIPVELAISPTQVEGRPYFTAYLRDISARKQAEAALRESQQRLLATYESALAGISEVDPGGRFLRVNEELCRMTGYSREELQSLTFRDITPPEDLWRDREQFERQMAGEIGTYRMEKRFIRKDGSLIWVDLSASRVDDGQGHPLYGVRVVRDITARKRAEEHRELLINELNHRVKNTLATVQSIAVQTLRNSDTAEEARSGIEARLFALSRAHDVLTSEHWEGAGLEQVATEAVAPYRHDREDRLQVTGPDVRLSPRMALSLAMALQELATNAIKYGALSNTSGKVRIGWTVNRQSREPRLLLTWTESGGPPVEAPRHRGFGMRLIERSLARDLEGEVQVDFDRAGLVCTIDALIT